MSALNLRLPDSLHDQVRVLASQDNVSMNQFIALAVAEKVSALMTVDYLAQRAKRGSREKFDAVLDKVRAVRCLAGRGRPFAPRCNHHITLISIAEKPPQQDTYTKEAGRSVDRPASFVVIHSAQQHPHHSKLWAMMTPCFCASAWTAGRAKWVTSRRTTSRSG